MRIPSGYVTAIFGDFEDDDEGGAAGLRWGYMVDKPKQRLVDEVRSSLRGIMQIFPKLAEGDYSEWVDAFEKQIAPTATPIAASD